MSNENFNPRAEAELEAAKQELAALNAEEASNEEEVKEENTVAEERVFTDIEKEQMALGWDPDKENGVSAEEFKRVGEIIEAKRKATRTAKKKSEEIERLQGTVKKLVEHNRQIEQAMYEKAARELYQQKLMKVEEGDVRAVQEIEKQQAALKPPAPLDEYGIQEQAANANEDISNHPDVVAFKEEFKKELTGTTVKDKAFQAYLAKRAYELEQEGIKEDVKDVLDTIKGELKELFPDSFVNPNKNKPALTERSTTSKSSKSSVSVSSLSYEDRVTFNQIKAADPSYTEEEYIKQLKLLGKVE